MIYFFRRRKALDYEQFKVNSENQNKQYELMSGITDIKLNGYDDYKMEEWRTLQERSYQMNVKMLKLGQIRGNRLYTHRAVAQHFHYLLDCCRSGEWAPTLGMMMSISAIIGLVNGPLSQLIGFLQQFQDAKISLERSEEVHLCANEDSIAQVDIPIDTPQDIEVNNRHFHTPEASANQHSKMCRSQFRLEKNSYSRRKRERKNHTDETASEIL